MKNFVTRLLALAHKETLHMLRDPQVIYLALGMPVVLLLLFGYAVSFDVVDSNIAVVDQSASPASRKLIRELDASDAFEVTHVLPDASTVEPLFRTGEVKAALVIPADLPRRLARGQAAEIQVMMDGADGTSARMLLGYTEAFGLSQTVGLVQTVAAARPPLEPRIRTLFNPEMDTSLFIVPGLMAVILAILSVLLSALSVAREWERGSMEQLFATPVDRLSVVVGKLLPYVALGLVQFLLVQTAGAWLFDVPFRGSEVLLMASVILFLICVLGQGLFISMATRNQQVAVQIGAVSSILPALLLSGFLFPVENMPAILRGISHVVPARYMITCMRGLLLQGRGFAELWPSFLGMALFALGIVAVTTSKFKRRLD